MWSRLLLCFFVGLAVANRPAWKENTEYQYQIHGRTIAHLHQVSEEHSGLFIKAKLTIKTRPDGNLDAKITEPQFAPFHEPIQGKWDAHVPDSKLQYQGLPISQKPFRIVVKPNGAIRDLIVSSEITNWEANFIKSIVSQFQVDTQGENIMSSHINILAQQNDNSAMFKTMEETVTGVSETLYEIRPLSEHALASKPYMVPKPELKQQDGHFIEIIKSKNFTNSKESPSYYNGFSEMHWVEPAGNEMGEFMSRTSVGRVVVTGTLKRFVIQEAITVDQITVAPTLSDKHRGQVNTLLNMTLLSVQPNSKQFEEIPSPITLGSIVYSYDDPFSASNKPRPNKEFEHDRDEASGETMLKTESLGAGSWLRSKRDLSSQYIRRMLSAKASSDEVLSAENMRYHWEQDEAELKQAPKAPLLPYFVGYEGKALKKFQDVVEITRKLAQRIAQEVVMPQQIPEKNSNGKFVKLCSIMRTMDLAELEKVSNDLYTQDMYDRQQNLKVAAWKIYRDAVGETGTGPALELIKKWAQAKKLESQEDAQIIQALSQSVRQPTEQFMKSFYELVKLPEVIHNENLNVTALLAYSKLAHEVYVHDPLSYNRFPVHSFGKFNSPSAKRFLKNDVIPYFTQKLHEAITQADTQKVHVYIRVLGNIGHRRILEAFEPYLEGTKHASQFQRVLMVLAMDKLAITRPIVARAVLFRIYRNPSENQKVRVAAVYQLMRTNPPAEMLQRMASYTNADVSEYVNAAVKSSIETAAQLEGAEHAQLRKAAESAEHLLTEKQYGEQYSRNWLRSYIVDEMQLAYKQSVQTYGHEDHILPEGVSYRLRAKFGGLRRHIVYLQGFVSSVDDLVNCFEQQTREYKRQQQQKDAENSGNQQWSSERIAKILNMKVEQREGLEGNLYIQMGQIQKILSFDNSSIEILPQVLQELEQTLKTGKQFKLQKFINDDEISIAFPTAMGFPFFYTYDKPVFVHIEGKVRASATPEISNGKNLVEPTSVKSEFDLRVLVSGKSQSQLGFITPFNHKRYVAGYDKNFQVHVPLSGSVDVDIKNMQTKIEIEPLKTQNDYQKNLIHYSSWPYTAQEEIFTLEPEHKIIMRQHPLRILQVVGDKATGIAAKLEISSDERIDLPWAYRKLQQHDPVSALLSPWLDDKIHYVKMNLDIDPEKTTTQKVVVRLGFQQRPYAEAQGKPISEGDEVPLEKFATVSEEPISRQNEINQFVMRGINDALVRIYDASIEFQGAQPITYVATVGTAKSNVNPFSRFIVRAQKRGGETAPVYFAVSGIAVAKNTNELDVNAAINMEPTVYVGFTAALGERFERSTRVVSHLKYTRSDERKQYLLNHPEHKQCLRQMQQGNHQLPHCAKMTAQATLLDKFQVKFNYKNPQPEIINATYKLAKVLEHALYPNVDINILEQNNQNEIKVEGQFYPDLEGVNMTVSTDVFRAQIKNVPVNEWARALLVPHPVYHVGSRLMGKLYNNPVHKSICVLDKTAASTFDNKTYPVSVSNDWTVLLQYVPRRPSPNKHQQQIKSAEEQLKQQVEAFSVLARATQQGGSQKEIKITFQTPETREKYVEITLKPAPKGQSPKLFVKDEEVKFDIKDAADVMEGYVQAYALPHNEIKVELRKAFYIIYDGIRAKITIIDHKFRGSVKGLCGTFTGEPATDFLSPENCILKTPEQFVAAYTVLENPSAGNPEIVQLQQEAKQGECLNKKVKYVNVISSFDVGRMGADIEYNVRPLSSSSCTRHHTQYVEDGDNICFTLSPLPACKPGCQAHGTIKKLVDVHCLEQTRATQMWVRQIQVGRSPDFSNKQPNKTVQIEVPQGCSP